jgi:hypothetical protein
MIATALTDRYAVNLRGVLSFDERIIGTGALPMACYAGGMTNSLYFRGIRIVSCLRVQTWAPFGLQFYCHCRRALARSLAREENA